MNTAPNRPEHPPTARTIVAGAVADDRGVRPGPLRLHLNFVPGGIRVAEITPHRGRIASRDHDLRDHVVLPGLVNAHTHLDLTAIGPIPHDPADGFASWADRVRTGRPRSAEEITAAVRRGVELARAGGTAAVGDIDGAIGSPRQPAIAADVRAASGLAGVSFVEFFAFRRFDRETDPRAVSPAFEAVLGGGTAGLGLSPHAPYSVSLDAMQIAARCAHERGLRLCTHLAESPEEHEFISTGRGPFRELLQSLGLWSPSASPLIGTGLDPVGYLEPALAAAPGRWLVAHANGCSRAGVATLAEHRVSVVYCPRASAYFGAADAFGAHRYREMLAASVNVCLGTDSMLNLDTPDRISVLDEARLLYRRDGTEPLVLLAMMTVNGARGLGLDPARFRIESCGSVEALTAVAVGADARADAVRRVLERDAKPAPIAPDFGGNRGESA